MDRPRARVTHAVDASPEDVFAFLSDLGNHWRLASGVVEIAEVDGAAAGGGTIELHGPLGLTRLARTRIAQAVAPADGVGGVIEGTAETPAGTLVRIAWNLTPAPRGTRIALELVVERATTVDRFLLALGARRWLERRLLERALADLEQNLQRR